jgi:MFS family permease
MDRFIAYFTEGPFRNVRFLFFICMLFPVQTLFAHQWLTMPPYVLRAYPDDVADRMEWIVSWINSGIIVVGVPIATALTRRVNVYTMMIIGTTVSALPTFLLAIEPRVELLVAYLVLFSIGEVLWQPRFLQYAAELAPEGRVAQYMGLANVPWVTAKMTTGLYSGEILRRYCPEGGPFRTETMWSLYAFIAVSTPIGLLLARRWVMRGERKHPTP